MLQESRVRRSGLETKGVMNVRRCVRAVSIVLACVALPVGPLSAQTQGRSPDPCALLTKNDVFRVLGWSIDSKEKKPYDMQGATGSMCFLAASQGEVIVTLPDLGTTYPGASVYSQSDAQSLSRSVYGLGAEVILYNGTVYISKHHRKVAVRVVPNDHSASYDEVQGFAGIVVRRLK